MRERTVLGPTGLDQFFLSQNVQFSAYILYLICIKGRNIEILKKIIINTFFSRLHDFLFTCSKEDLKELAVHIFLAMPFFLQNSQNILSSAIDFLYITMM